MMVPTRFLFNLKVKSFSVVNNIAVKNGLFIYGAKTKKASSKEWKLVHDDQKDGGDGRVSN